MAKQKQEELELPGNIKIQPEHFETFYQKFHFVKEMLNSPEWKETWSHFYEFNKYELEINIKETDEEIEAYSFEKQVQETRKCHASFEYWAHKYAKITHPMIGMVKFKAFKYQRRTVGCYGANRFNILSKFRQGGLTTVSVLYAVWKCLFSLDQQIMFISKTDQEAIAAGEIAKKCLQELPTWMLPEMGKSNEHEKQFVGTGSNLWSVGVERARGKAITILFIDEAAFIADMDTHWKAMYPVISTGGACNVISTVNGLGNWYEGIYHGAEEKKNQFNVIDIDYWEHPEYYNPKWVKDTRANLGEKGWAQEVLRSFLGSGETWVSPKILEVLEQKTRDIVPVRVLFDKWNNQTDKEVKDWETGALWIWEEPIDGREYILSGDVAEGMGDDGDNSCFHVIDTSNMKQVAEFYSNLVPINVFAQIVSQIGNYYKTALVVFECNAQAQTVINALQNTLHYDNLYRNHKHEAGIRTLKNNRGLILEALQNRLFNNDIIISSKRLVHELSTFIYNRRTKKAEAQRGKHDDAILALCLGLYAKDLQDQNMPLMGGAATQEVMSVMKTQMYEEIRQEILEGSPEDWQTTEIEKEDDDEDLASMYRRKNSKILSEFGW